MTPLVFMLLLLPCSVWGSFGLPELTRDVLERIRAATGQPIDTNRFIPLPSTRSHRYLKASGNRNLDRGRYNLIGKDEHFGGEKDPFFEIFEQDRDGNELEEHEYEDEARESRGYNEEKHFQKNHHKIGGGMKGGRSRKGRKRGKFHVEKGFRDIYHKDEEKKSDFFWNNAHEEGKWIEYGLKNRKQEKSKEKGGEGKQEKDRKEESSYEKKEDKCTKCKT